jgi:16S rRNA (uracil1498-N3)-methyltransferase
MLTLFIIDSLPTEQSFEVKGGEAHHAIKVLRTAVGEEISISDGKGNWVRAKVSEISKSSFFVQVIERGTQVAGEPKLTVLQALPKSDRTKEAIELLVQAGVDQIIPWSAERAIAKATSDTQSKWQVAAFAATKQSRRFIVASVAQPVDSKGFLASKPSDSALLVFHESAKVKLSSVVTKEMNNLAEIIVVIGPEGGISQSELELFEQSGGKVVAMGEPVFRSAHAGAAALSAISALIGRW